MARIGIFGGTFDPPHIGHLILGAEACEQLGLDRLLWVLTPDPPHKRGRYISPLPQRLDLLRAALDGNPAFELSPVDIDRPPPHYALDTMQILRQLYPGAELIYLLGGDSLRDLPVWHLPLDFVAACDALGVMRRPGDAVDLFRLEQQLPGIGSRLRFIRAPLLEISSSDIRRRIRQNRTFRYFLPPAVYDLIQERRLYRHPLNLAL